MRPHLHFPHSKAARLARRGLALVAVVTGMACTPAVVEDPPTGILEPEQAPDGTLIRRFDLDGDGKPNLWRVVVNEGGTERTVRRDEDLNFDGRVDTRHFFGSDGVLVKEEIDLDYDTRVDAIATYEGGVKIREEHFLPNRPKPHVIRLYSNGKLIEKQRDQDGDGIYETFEYFDEGKLIRIGRDTTGDGKPDAYDERPDPSEIPPEEKESGDAPTEG